MDGLTPLLPNPSPHSMLIKTVIVEGSSPFRVNERECNELVSLIKSLVSDSSWNSLPVVLGDPRTMHSTLYRTEIGRSQLKVWIGAVRNACGTDVVAGIFSGLMLTLLRAPDEYSDENDALCMVDHCHNLLSVFGSESRWTNVDLLDASWADCMLLHSKAKKIAKKASGKISIPVAKCTVRLGVTYFQYSKVQEGIERFHIAWATLTTLQVVHHPLESEIFRNLAEAYAVTSHFVHADYFLARCPSGNKTTEDKLFEVSVLKIHGILAFKQKTYRKCNAIFNRIIEIKSEIWGEDHWELANHMYMRALVLFCMKRLPAAMSEYQKALRIQMNFLSFTHPDMDHLSYTLGLMRPSKSGSDNGFPLKLVIVFVWFFVFFQKMMDSHTQTPLVAYSLVHLADLYCENG